MSIANGPLGRYPLNFEKIDNQVFDVLTIGAFNHKSFKDMLKFYNIWEWEHLSGAVMFHYIMMGYIMRNGFIEFSIWLLGW